MTTEHEKNCTHMKYPEDRDILTRPLFAVNMRFFKINPEYKKLVLACCEYIKLRATTTREGYTKPYGFSGANAGIPFNIIATREGLVLINPKIIEALGSKESLSNCGSLTLEKPIKVTRYECIKVSYFDLAGIQQEIEGYLPTIQHEIDHNNGILISDRSI